MLMVPEDEWCLDTLLVKNRRDRLLNPPSPTQLLERLAAAAVQSVSDGLVQLYWVPACNMPSFCRIEAVIPLPKDVFDYLFNGRSGYRAQYYLSPAIGEQYNRSVVEGLEKAVSTAFKKASSLPVGLDVVTESLYGRYSKIWVSGDWAAFLREPNILLAKCWTEYWSTTQDAPLGLKAPLPPSPAIDLKGTFIRPETREDWLDPGRQTAPIGFFEQVGPKSVAIGGGGRALPIVERPPKRSIASARPAYWALDRVRHKM